MNADAVARIRLELSKVAGADDCRLLIEKDRQVAALEAELLAANALAESRRLDGLVLQQVLQRVLGVWNRGSKSTRRR